MLKMNQIFKRLLQERHNDCKVFLVSGKWKKSVAHHRTPTGAQQNVHTDSPAAPTPRQGSLVCRGVSSNAGVRGGQEGHAGQEGSGPIWGSNKGKSGLELEGAYGNQLKARGETKNTELREQAAGTSEKRTQPEKRRRHRLGLQLPRHAWGRHLGSCVCATQQWAADPWLSLPSPGE